MKNILYVLLALLGSCLTLEAQIPRPDQQLVKPLPPSADNTETLLWVQDRANRIQLLLNSAILAGNQVTLMQNMLDAYQEFDAITLVALYCRPAAIKAEMGRKMCNLLDESYRTDLLSLNKRAMDARELSMEIRQDIGICLDQLQIDSSALFAPNKLIQSDAEFVELDLQDGLASQNFSIFNQKVDHAIRLLEEIALLASTLDGCDDVLLSTQIAKNRSLDALAAENWDVITENVNEALEEVQILKVSRCLRKAE
jgi:hypothetical protein